LNHHMTHISRMGEDFDAATEKFSTATVTAASCR
jgi:hypothetical protein